MFHQAARCVYRERKRRIYRERFVRVYVWATPAHRASNRNFNVMWSDFRRHGSQCACYYGPRRTKKADREHEVPSFNGALASIQKYCRVSTVPTLLFIPIPFEQPNILDLHSPIYRLNIPKSCTNSVNKRYAGRFSSKNLCFTVIRTAVKNGVSVVSELKQISSQCSSNIDNFKKHLRKCK